MCVCCGVHQIIGVLKNNEKFYASPPGCGMYATEFFSCKIKLEMRKFDWMSLNLPIIALLKSVFFILPTHLLIEIVVFPN